MQRSHPIILTQLTNQSNSYAELSDNDYLFDFNGTIDIDLIHNTVADNQVQESIIRTDFNPNVGNPSTLEVHFSIIDNPVNPIYSFDELDFTLGGGVMHVTVSACFLNETNSISSSLLINDAVNYSEGPLNDTADPELIVREDGYYYLSQTSPAINYINTPARTSVLHPDIDFDRRGINSLNVNGTPLFYHDAGADETIWGLSDLIFENGFEANE